MNTMMCTSKQSKSHLAGRLGRARCRRVIVKEGVPVRRLGQWAMQIELSMQKDLESPKR